MHRVLVVLVTLGALAAGAPAAHGETFTGFRSVLAQGEGQSVSVPDLAANQAFGTVPDSFVNQQPLYVGIMPAAAGLTEADLDRFYKRSDFGVLPGGPGRTIRPRSGVEVVFDAAFGVPRITGQTRADVMWGAGYVQALERLFLMDVVRRTAKGTTSGLLGAGVAADDAAQLTDQDFSDEELTAQFADLARRLGAEGARAQRDLLDYVAGINARITEVNLNPVALPAEYLALGARPEPWSISDTAAAAVLLVTQFTVSNGGEEVNAAMRQELRSHFGRDWRAKYEDLRLAQDPEAIVMAKRPFRSDDPGRRRSDANLVPDAGSVVPRNPQVGGPGAEEQRRARAAMPAWQRSAAALKKALPPTMSNAVMVTAAKSRSGRALAAMGPQVSYFSPQIFVEHELHGGGIDVSGVTFPGASPYPLIGHGTDFAWSGTSANGDNEDTFAERLCEPDGKEPTQESTHYVYRGRCIPFTMRDQVVTTPYSPLSPDAPPETVRFRTMRSVHGPVFAFATAGGKPIALAKAKAVDFHELEAVASFMRLAENQPRDARSFLAAMSDFPGTENWFYVDSDEVAVLQSGRYPRHARGADVDLPFDGDGSGDWQGFDPATYTAKYLPMTRRPRVVDPADGFIISWNQKEAIGWRKGPSSWTAGPVQDALRLERRLLAEMKRGGGKVDLAGLTRTVNLAATTDLRGSDVLPWMLRAMGRGDSSLVGLLRDWNASGAKRLDADGDNLYEHGAAIALFDAWWPRAVRAQFGPALGERLFGQLRRVGLSAGNFDQWGWASHVQKDLRAVLGRRVPGWRHRWCGGAPVPARVSARRAARVRGRCAAALSASLEEAAAAVRSRLGDDPAGWKVPATCPETRPASCDQIVPTVAGAIATPPFPWQDRGTFHQIVEVSGHR